MGIIKNNVVTKGFSGKFGDDLVFRQLDNKTFFTKRAVSKAAPSTRQLEIRNNFAEAANFASEALDDPQTSRDYKLMAELLGLKSAYLAAVTDYLTPPEIQSVYTARYDGSVGGSLSIKPKVPYKIIDVDVTILRPDNTVLESGKAVANELKWKYQATVENPVVRGSKLVIVTRDRRGQESTFEQVL